VTKLLDLFINHPQNEWDYYSNVDNEKTLENPFAGGISHGDFIKKYFHRGGKDGVLNNKNFDIKQSLLDVAPHSNSIFFLGSALYHRTKIKDLLFPREMNPAGYEVFPFLWFLSCLFHDLGYSYEQSSQEYLESVVDIDSAKKKFKISSDFRSRKLTGISNVLVDSIPRYFILRRFSDRKIDHGILAGLYLYDSLVKNRREKLKGNNNNLFWGKVLEKQYAIAAATIACHNIWVNQRVSIESYKQFDLNQLIAFQPLKVRDFPFLYLLGIVDTMDPIKLYGREGVSSMQVLEDILIEVTEDSVSFSKRDDSSLDFKKLVEQTRYLRDWLDVEISVESNNVKLKLKF
jgi:hypothetical protein